jgi:F-type H+-transporting ATPase subunit delta
MKKITPKQYATSLYESIKDSHGEELTMRIRNFLLVIKKRKDLKNINKIYQAFVKVYQISEGILSAEVTTSHPLNHKVKEEIIHWLKIETKRDPELTEKVDSEILGGVIIKYEDTIIDASLKNRLNNLQIKLNK